MYERSTDSSKSTKARRFKTQQKLQILKEWELTANGMGSSLEASNLTKMNPVSVGESIFCKGLRAF